MSISSNEIIENNDQTESQEEEEFLEKKQISANSTKKRNKIIRYVIGFLIAGVTFGLLFYYFPIKEVIAVFKEAKIVYVLLAIVMYIIALVFTTLRYSTFFDVKFPNLFIANLYSMFNSDITPGRSGFISIIFSLRKRGISYDQSTMALGVTQFLDFTIRCIIIIMSGVIIFQIFNVPIHWVLILIALALLFVILLFLVVYTKIIAKITSKFPNVKFLQKIKHLFENVNVQAINNKKKLPILTIYSLFSWIFTTLRWGLCSYALGINIPIYYALIIQPIIAISAFIPFTIAGLGITETLSVFILQPLGLEAEAIIALMLLDRMVAFTVDIFGLIEWKWLMEKKNE